MRSRSFALGLAVCLIACLGGGCGKEDTASVPLSPDSPWPKFRGNAAQTGATSRAPVLGGAMWRFETGKGIFSSPVVGGDGTIYVGTDSGLYRLTGAKLSLERPLVDLAPETASARIVDIAVHGDGVAVATTAGAYLRRQQT